MQEAMESLGLTPPTFESDAPDRSFRAIFYRHHFMDEDDLAWLEQYQAQQLGADAQKALVYARKTGRVDNAAYRSLNRVDTLTASRALTQLEAAGLLHRSEQRREPGVVYATRWRKQHQLPRLLLRLLVRVWRKRCKNSSECYLLLAAWQPQRQHHPECVI